jgi:2-C-methyl-D-erythritol 2,4-cyclodiphosphate synthase
MRVGLGFDHHTAATAETIVQVVHGAVIEALVGGAGLDADGAGAGGDTVNGERDLREAVRLIERHNYQIVNIDITLMADGPRADFHLPELRGELAEVLHVSPTSVSTKQAGGTAWLRDDGGVAAIAVALLDQIADLDALHASIRSGG